MLTGVLDLAETLQSPEIVAMFVASLQPNMYARSRRHLFSARMTFRALAAMGNRPQQFLLAFLSHSHLSQMDIDNPSDPGLQCIVRDPLKFNSQPMPSIWSR